MVQTQEQDTRLGILNSLLRTPHRDMQSIFRAHADAMAQDPLFYSHLGAWYFVNGEVRDHKEMFAGNLSTSDFDGHRDVGLALLRELPPYQVARVVNLVHGAKDKFSFKRNIPRSMQTEVTRYLRERENDQDWFDSSALVARKAMKRLYALLHVAPSDYAQQVLFDGDPPEDSKLFAVKQLRQTNVPSEQAKVIIDNKVPYRVASTVIDNITPTVLFALIEVMSDQELISNMGSLRKRGAFLNADLKQVIKERLDKAKTGENVTAFKALEAVKVAGVDADTAKQLEKVADSQVKKRGRIERPTAILIDKSGSMSQSIELGKRIASMVSAISDSDLFVYAFDSMPYEIKCDGQELADWEKAMKGVFATGRTSCGAGIAALTRKKQYVEQIIMISDQGENTSPPFLTTLQNYCEQLSTNPSVCFINCGRKHKVLEEKATRNGFEVDSYDFDGDYYSLPNLIPFLTKSSRLDLLMEIMDFELPQRKLD